ncbi:hypothetical protein JVU11DRAFT_11371 [Chiua virens]|nr:hypothetical protein JVU11DRAFT_11371 [Chiua virens]
METLQMPALPPLVDAPDFCFCGRKTVESHEYWYCSMKCARSDALRSLGDDPECHYRNVVRRAYIRAGAQALIPRRMMSVDQLRSSDHRRLVNGPPPFPTPTGPLPNPPSEGNARPARKRDKTGFPTLSQVTGKILAKKAMAGEPLIAERHDQLRYEDSRDASSRAHPVQSLPDQPVEQIDLDAIPLPEPRPVRTLRRVPQSSNSLRSNIRKSAVALFNAGRSRKDKEGENPERVFGHPVNTIVPPVRKESLPSQSQEIPPSPSAVSEQRSKTLRRSVSFAGWDANLQGSRMPSDPLMLIIEELREECTRSFDPRSLFDVMEDSEAY